MFRWMYESNQTKCRSTERGESRYSFRRIDVNPGEEQLVAVVVVSRPLGNHLSDISQITNETWYQKINIEFPYLRIITLSIHPPKEE